jgi:phosphohistidine phosphatase SixA
MKPKKFYKTQWNFQDRSKDADALVYRHTTLEMIDFAKKYHKQQLTIPVVSHQRELLELVTEIASSNQVYSNTRHKLWAKKLISSNCS